MKQVLHIFRKDVRHFWREIVAVLVLVVLYGVREVQSWSESANMAYGLGGIFGGYRLLLGLVVVLLPLAWVFIVTRSVHEESLVGDQQFWVTRPYRWPQLLIAKIVFLLAFVSVPAFLLQIVLLAKAGFSPTHYLIGLVGIDIGTLLLLFPIFVLATVTSSSRLMGLAILAVLLLGIGGSMVGMYVSSSGFAGPSGAVVLGLACLTGIAVVLLQYSRRKTLLSRLLLVSLVVLVLVTVAVFPYEHFINRDYPALRPGTHAPVSFALQPPPPRNDGEPANGNGVVLALPLGVSEIANSSIIHVVGHQAILDGPGGFHWESGWQPGGEFLFPGREKILVNVQMTRKVFEQVKLSPVKMTLKVALAVYTDQARRNFVVPAGRFELQKGICSPEPAFQGNIECMAPLHRPEFVLITADLSKSTCPLAKDELPAHAGEIGRGYVISDGDDWLEPSISPVERFNLVITDFDRADEHRPRGICPGTPITLSNPHLAYLLQTEMQADNVKLDDYAMRLSAASGLFVAVPR